MGMSSTNPTIWIVERSANFKIISEGFNSPIPILLKRDKGNKLTLAPRSHNVFSTVSLPITHGMAKPPRSLSLGGGFFMIALPSLVKAIVSLCSIVFFFEKISFKNLAYKLPQREY